MESSTPIGRPSRRLSFEDAVQVWLLLWSGEFKHRIAAKFDVNVWRVYDVKNGKLHPSSREAAEKLWRDRPSAA